MEDPGAYEINSNIQRRVAQEVFPYIVSKMTWTKAEAILDFGCGQGFVTKNILKPLIDGVSPGNTIYGMDIASKMIDFASANYAASNITYMTADIMKDTELEMPCKFDKIVSSFVLHWIFDQKKALQRMYEMLNVNGEIGMFYVASNSCFPIFETMAKKQKWAQHLGDIDAHRNFTPPPTQHDLDPVHTTRKMLETIGLAVDECATLTSRTLTYDSFDTLIEFYLALDPNIRRIPVSVLADYKTDLRQEFRSVVRDISTPKFKNGVEIDNVMLIIRARKEA